MAGTTAEDLLVAKDHHRRWTRREPLPKFLRLEALTNTGQP